MQTTPTRIRSFPIERVHGPLLAPRQRFETFRMWATWAGLVIYLVMMALAFPKEFWIEPRAHTSAQPTVAALILLLIPLLVVLVFTAMWQVQSESMRGRHGAPSLELVGDELSVEIDGSEKRRVKLIGATLSVGTWLSGGHVTGPLLVIAGPSERISIGAPAAALAGDATQGSPDVELSEAQYQELAQELGVYGPRS